MNPYWYEEPRKPSGQEDGGEWTEEDGTNGGSGRRKKSYDNGKDDLKRKNRAEEEKNKAKKIYNTDDEPLDGKEFTDFPEEPIKQEKSFDKFHKAITEARNSQEERNAWRVDVHDAEDYENDKLFTSKGGSCVAVEPDGNIISVCKKRGDADIYGSDLLKHAVKAGGDRLDAFGRKLFNFYTKNGFEPVSWVKFDRNYAPNGWRANVDGEEPVIFYRYTGKKSDISYLDFKKKIQPSSDYDTAKNIRDRSMKK